MKDTPKFYHLHYLQNIEFDASNSEIWSHFVLINHVFTPYYQEETWLVQYSTFPKQYKHFCTSLTTRFLHQMES